MTEMSKIQSIGLAWLVRHKDSNTSLEEVYHSGAATEDAKL